MRTGTSYQRNDLKRLKSKFLKKFEFMKTITTSYNLDTNGKILAVSLLALFRAVGLEGEVTPAEIPASVLDTLRVRLASPGVTGAQELSTDATKACHYSIEGSTLTVTLGGLSGGVHRLWITTQYGTNTRSLLLVDLNAPENLQFLENNGAVVMPLIRNAAKDAELDGVQFYGYSYPYTGETCWLTTAKPLHLRGTVTAYYADDDETALADATALTSARIVLNTGTLVYDPAGSEPIQLGAVESFGSTGGGSTTEETVTVLLTLPDGAEAVDWTQYHIAVDYLSQGDSDDITLDANGRAQFTVPAGEQYMISFPYLEGYANPIAETFTAVGGEKSVHYAYRVNANVELVTIYAKNDAGADISALIGQTVTLVTDGGIETQTTFGDNYKATFEIPYGDTYTIHVPTISGWHPHKSNFTGTADRAERFYIAHYIPEGAGAFGIDANGTRYTEEEISALEDKTIIKYIGYTDSVLEAADRGDGTVGCGFMFEIPVAATGKQWATQNVQFDTALLPNLNGTQAAADYKSAHNTQLMQDIATDLGISSPAADYALSQQITIGETTLTSWVPAAGIWQKIVDNWTVVNAISQAAGRGTLPFKSGTWWASSQYNATDAWCLGNGSLNRSGNKYNSDGVARFFDLYV